MMPFWEVYSYCMIQVCFDIILSILCIRYLYHMKALIIPFPTEHVERKRQPPLSRLMIDKLLTAYSLEKQHLFLAPRI